MSDAAGGHNLWGATTPAAAVSAVVGLATQRLVGRRVALKGPETTVEATIGSGDATSA